VLQITRRFSKVVVVVEEGEEEKEKRMQTKSTYLMILDSKLFELRNGCSLKLLLVKLLFGFV
jgi:hypothetical protein